METSKIIVEGHDSRSPHQVGVLGCTGILVGTLPPGQYNIYSLSRVSPSQRPDSSASFIAHLFVKATVEVQGRPGGTVGKRVTT